MQDNFDKIFLLRKCGVLRLYDLGAILRDLRKKKNWTQKRVAKAINVSEPMISKYEANLAAPSFEAMRSYASIFNVSLDELFGIQPKGTLSLHGLSDEQIKIMQELAELFRNRKLNYSDADIKERYAVLGHIVSELSK